jgi:DHA2 family methylenomycin A resistance protein-like MFS transporter
MSGFVSPVSARLAERFGPRLPIVGGLLLGSAGLIVLAVITPSASAWLLAGLIVPVGIGGPLIIQPTTTVLLDSVPAHRAGIASGVFNTSRQLGGALAIAVFGALLASRAHFVLGLRESLVIAAAASFAAAVANLVSKPSPRH